MSRSKSLVVLGVPSWQAIRKKRWRRLTVLALAGAVAGAVGLGAFGLSFLLGQRLPNSLPEIGVAPVVFAEPWLETPLPIHVTPTGSVGGGFIRIDGLPGLAKLSEGHVERLGAWKVPISLLPTLKLTAPPTGDAKPTLTITLLSHDGLTLGETRPLLAVMPVWHVGRLPTPPTGPSSRAKAKAPDLIAEPAPAWLWPGAREEAKSLVKKGDEALARGSIQAARRIYEYAAMEMRWPAAALALAATYDPHELARLAPHMKADPQEARLWYARAQELANDRTDFFMRRLGLPIAP